MNARTRLHGFTCPTCLDFEVLPGVGPCPNCRPAAYVEFMRTLADQTQLRDVVRGEAA